MSTSPVISAGLPLSRAIGAAFAGPRFSIGRAYYAEAAKAAQAGRIEAVAEAPAARDPQRAAITRPADRVELSTAPPERQRPTAQTRSEPRSDPRPQTTAPTYGPRSEAAASSGRALDLYA